MIREYDIENPIKLDEGNVLVDFHAKWCGPCKMTSKYLEKFNETHPEINIVKVDVDECESVAEKYGVQNLPYILYMIDGEVEWHHVGMITDKQLEDKLGC